MLKCNCVRYRNINSLLESIFILSISGEFGLGNVDIQWHGIEFNEYLFASFFVPILGSLFIPSWDKRLTKNQNQILLEPLNESDL